MSSVFGGKAKGARLERMRASPRWVGGSFRNVHPMIPRLATGVSMPTLADFFRSGVRRVPGAPLPIVDPRETWRVPAKTGLRATWLGHSTLLLEVDGVRVLTDPVWGPRASPFSMAGPKRFHSVPVELGELPPVDVVLLSHDHYDHFDYPAIRKLAKTDVPFVTSLGVGAHLESWGVAVKRITELDWWESHTLPGRDLTITATPAQHFSGRTMHGRNSTLWSSFVLRGPTRNVFFGADTGLTTLYSEIAQRAGPFDLVMLEIGAYHPAWGDLHLGPGHAALAYEMLGAGVLLPIHWGTFKLAMHEWDEPIETLVAEAAKRRIPLVTPKLGQPVEPLNGIAMDPWWRAVAAAERKVGRAVAPAEEEAPVKRVSWPLD